jgi:hypothetical protein
MFYVNDRKFRAFAAAAGYATRCARKDGECAIRRSNGALVVDVFKGDDGKLLMLGIGEGKKLVEEHVRASA